MILTKLLITRYGGCGDMIMMEPAIEALYYKYRPAEIHLRTHPHYADLHRYHPLIEEHISGILTAGPSAPGLDSDLKKPEGYDYFFNTTGAVEMNRGIHGIDSFAFSTGAQLLRRTPVMYLKPGTKPVPLDIVVHTPKRSGDSPRNADFRNFDIPKLLSEYLRDNGIQFKEIIAIGSDPEKPEAIQNFAACIAGAKLFVGPDSAGAHIAAALSVPSVVAYTDDFPASIRSYPNCVAVRDNNVKNLLKTVAHVFSNTRKPDFYGGDQSPRLSYIASRLGLDTGDGFLCTEEGITENEDWRDRLAHIHKHLPSEGRLVLYERHSKYDGFDAVLLVKFMIETLGFDILEYTATSDFYGRYYVIARKL